MPNWDQAAWEREREDRQMTHTLKTWPFCWDAIKRGEKNFDVRRDDRGFQKGDTLELVRYDPLAPDSVNNSARNSPISRRIIYILTGGQLGIEPGHVVLGLEEMK